MASVDFYEPKSSNLPTINNVLIYGAAGFLGEKTAELFDRKGYTVHRKTRTKDPEYDKLDLVVNCAGRVGGIQANIDSPADFLFENVESGFSAIHLALETHARLINVSSACSYPEFATYNFPLSPCHLWEGRPHKTHAPYGLAKRIITEACQAYRKQYGLKATTLIMANFYGPGCPYGPGSHVIPALIERFANAVHNADPEVVIRGTPEIMREFLYIEDAARAIEYFKECDSEEPINIGSGECVNLGSLVRSISEYFDYRGVIKWNEQAESGQKIRQMDTSAADRAGFKTQTRFFDGLKRTMADYKLK